MSGVASQTGNPVDAHVGRVLSQLPGVTGAPADWTVIPFATGGQALLFRATRREAAAATQPAAGAATQSIVIKIYKASVLTPDNVTQDEFESLGRLHERLNGAVLHGWEICCPTPLLRSTDPFGLAVTQVPGTALSTMLEQRPDPALQATVDSLALPIYAALQRYWAGEARLYGDLRLNNILCDPATRQLSLIDPGKPFDAFSCDGVSKAFYPASRDLAYLLYSAAVSVRATLRHPGARQRMVAVAESVLRTALDDAGSPARRAALHREIIDCGQAHLQMIRVGGMGPGALWRRVVRWTASRCMKRSLNRLASVQPDVAVPATVPAAGLPTASC